MAPSSLMNGTHRGIGLASVVGSRRRRNLVRLLLAIAASPAASVWGGQGAETTVRLERIDGSVVEGGWLGLRAGLLEVRSSAETVQVPLDAVATVEFPSASTESQAHTGVTVYLDDGGVIPGELLEAADEGIVLNNSIAGRTTLQFDDLAAIRFANPVDYARADEVFAATLRQRLPGQDVLITRSVDEPKTVRGRLETLDAARGAFAFGETSRTFVIDRMYAIVFAAGANLSAPLPTMCRLADGSSFSASLVAADAAKLSLVTSFGVTVDVPLDRLSLLEFVSGRLTYASDLTPVAQRAEGRLHRAWPIRFDRNAAGGPIVLGGRAFRKGLGVHSFTEVVFELDRPYDSFAATIGIDDAVRPRGNAVFKIFGEGIRESSETPDSGAVRLPLPGRSAPAAGTAPGESPARRPLFDSGPLTGRDAPRDIVVDIRGFRRIILTVDYGEELDLSDYADWAGARFILPPAPGGDRVFGKNP